MGSHEERRHPSEEKNNQVQMDLQDQEKRNISLQNHAHFQADLGSTSKYC
jgi:hypothetical protein